MGRRDALPPKNKLNLCPRKVLRVLGESGARNRESLRNMLVLSDSDRRVFFIFSLLDNGEKGQARRVRTTSVSERGSYDYRAET